MNGDAFDRLSRRMAAATSRRDVLRVFAATLGGLAFGVFLPRSESIAGSVPCCPGGGSDCNDYCASGQVCVNGTVCCDDPGSPSSCPACGSTYCLPEPLEYCLSGACCNGLRTCGSSSNAFCCPPTMICTYAESHDQCCDQDNNNCCPLSLTCNGQCCNPGQSCINGQCCYAVNGQCCEQSQICGNTCCPANSCCNNGVCTTCPSGQTCSNGVCCEQGITGCQGTCCPAGWSCQTDNCGYTTCISPCDQQFLSYGSCLCNPSSAYPVCCYAPNDPNGDGYDCCPSGNTCLSNGCNGQTAQDLCPSDAGSLGNSAPCCLLAATIYGACVTAGVSLVCGQLWQADVNFCNGIGCSCTAVTPSEVSREPRPSPSATPTATPRPPERTPEPTTTPRPSQTPAPRSTPLPIEPITTPTTEPRPSATPSPTPRDRP